MGEVEALGMMDIDTLPPSEQYARAYLDHLGKITDAMEHGEWDLFEKHVDALDTLAKGWPEEVAP